MRFLDIKNCQRTIFDISTDRWCSCIKFWRLVIGIFFDFWRFWWTHDQILPLLLLRLFMVQLFKHPKETGLRISIQIQYSKYLSKRVPKYPDEYNILIIYKLALLTSSKKKYWSVCYYLCIVYFDQVSESTANYERESL